MEHGSNHTNTEFDWGLNLKTVIENCFSRHGCLLLLTRLTAAHDGKFRHA